ncbi:hypothetical protein OG900_28095 [Streptomyces sp. NBC_00433]
MARRRGSGPVSGPLEIRAAGIGWQLFSLACSSLGVLRLAFDHNHYFAVTGWVLLALPVASAALLVGRQVRLRGQEPLLRIDDGGIALFDGHTVGWGEISEVREVTSGTGLAFLPKGSAELPAFAPVLLPAGAKGLARRRTERFGTPLVIYPRALDTSKEAIVAAVGRYGIPYAGAESAEAAIT